MKPKFKTILAFSLLALAVMLCAALSILDAPHDIFPNENTAIELYGEAHGVKEYYDLEFDIWNKLYNEGCRKLFIELPYFGAEFLNIWMEESTDGTLTAFFSDIRGTAGDTPLFREFLQKIKANCPKTVFYGTDVGHAGDTMGARYLAYLESAGLASSENYKLSEENIRQWREYREDEGAQTGISPIREHYMAENFKAAYERCGGGKIMGIYGGYHVDATNPNVMAGMLRAEYGERLAAVQLINLIDPRNAYDFGVSISGILFLLMRYIPNIVLFAKNKAAAAYLKRENKLLFALESFGLFVMTASLALFRAFDPRIMRNPGRSGLLLDLSTSFYLLAFALMLIYIRFYIRYHKRRRSVQSLNAAYLGFPIARAFLPSAAAIILGVYSQNLIVLGAAVLFALGRIGSAARILKRYP